jgi:hypothetical protein
LWTRWKNSTDVDSQVKHIAPHLHTLPREWLGVTLRVSLPGIDRDRRPVKEARMSLRWDVPHSCQPIFQKAREVIDNEVHLW